MESETIYSMALHNNFLISCFLKSLKKIWSVPVLCVLLFTLQNVGIAFSNPGDDWEKVTIIPRNGREFENFTQHLNCSKRGLKAMYLLHSTRKITIVGCSEEKRISTDFCPELNAKGAQESYNAIRTPNEDETVYYNASDSYLLYDCFETYGAIPSPQEREKNIEYFQRKNADLNKTNTCLQEDIKILNKKISEQDEATVNLQKENADLKQTNKRLHEDKVICEANIKYYIFISVVVTFVAILLLKIILIFLVRKFVYNNKISLGDFRKDTIRLLRMCIVQIAMGIENRKNRPQITMESEEGQIVDTETSRLTFPQNPETGEV